jgi:hypothetical protein
MNEKNAMTRMLKVLGLGVALTAGALAMTSRPATGQEQIVCDPEAGSCGRVGSVECCRLCSGSIVCGISQPPIHRPGHPSKPGKAAK